MEIEEARDIELLERIELKFGLADSREKLQVQINNFLIPLLNKLNTNSPNVKNKDKSQYLPRLLQTSKDRPHQQQLTIDTIVIKVLCEIGSSSELDKINLKFGDADDIVHVLHLARDFFLLNVKPAQSTQDTSDFPGLSQKASDMLTSNQNAKWCCDSKELGWAKLAMLKLIMQDKLYAIYNPVNERYIALLCASSSAGDHDISTKANDALKHSDLPDYEDSNFITQVYTMFLGGQFPKDIYGVRQPCSVKLKLALIKLLTKSRAAAQKLPEWLKLIFESLFGALTNDPLRKEGINFMTWVLQQNSPQQLKSTGPILAQGIKKVLGLGGNSGSSFFSGNNEILRMKAYRCWSTLASKVPEIFGADTSDFEVLISLLETEPKSLHSEVQEALYSIGKSIFQKTKENPTLESRILNIIEPHILLSQSSHLKITLLRLLKDGPEFLNTRARAICIVGSGDLDLHVNQYSELVLKMDLKSLNIAVPILTEGGFNGSNQDFIKEISEKLPTVSNWLSQAVHLITWGKTTDVFGQDRIMNHGTIEEFLSSLKLKYPSTKGKNLHNLNDKVLENLVDFTFQLVALHGLCLIAKESFSFQSANNSQIDKNWFDFGIEKINEEAKRFIVNWNNPKIDDRYLEENPILQLSIYASLSEFNSNPTDKIKLGELFLVSILPITLSQEKSESNQSHQSLTILTNLNKKMALFYRTICTLGPTALNSYFIENIEKLLEICTQSKSHESIIYMSQAMGYSFMTCLDSQAIRLGLNEMPNVDTLELISELASIAVDSSYNATTLYDNYYKAISKNTSDSSLGKKDFKAIDNYDFMTRISFLSHVLPRLLVVLNYYPEIQNYEHFEALRTKVTSSVSKLLLLLLTMLVDYKQLLVSKNKQNASFSHALVNVLCVSVNQLGSFGYALPSDTAAATISDSPAFSGNPLFNVILDILQNNTTDIQQLRPLLSAICGISLSFKNFARSAQDTKAEETVTALASVRAIYSLVSLEKIFIKKAESQLCISEAIPYTFAKWKLSKAKQNYFGSLSFPFSDICVGLELSTDSEKQYLQFIAEKALPKMVSSNHTSERLAAAAWVGNLALYCSNLQTIFEYLVPMHKMMCLLLIDSDENIQSMAGKCLSLLYDISNVPSMKAEMLYSIVDTIGKKRIQMLTADSPTNSSTSIFNQLIPDTQSRNNTSSHRAQNARTNLSSNRNPRMNSETIQTFRSLLDLATEIGHAEMFYSFVVLAGKGLSTVHSFGSSYYSLKTISTAVKSTLPYAEAILPKLYFMCFNVNPSIAKTTNSIWSTLFATLPPNISFHDSASSGAYPLAANMVTQNWESVYNECIRNMGSSDWKNRQCSCRALDYILKESGNLALQPDVIEVMWKTGFRLLDDIKDSVRGEALILCNTLSRVTLAWSDPKNDSSKSIGKSLKGEQHASAHFKITGNIEHNINSSGVVVSTVIPLFIDSGLVSPSKDVRSFVITFLSKLSVIPSIKPYAPRLIIKMLEALSDNEDEAMNFISQNASNWNIESNQLDSFRLDAAKSSKTMQIIDTCLGHLDSDSMRNFVEQVRNVISHGIGLPTRAGTARLVVNLTVNYPLLVTPYTTPLIKTILSVVKKSPTTEMHLWANAVSSLSSHMTERMFTKLLEKISKMYFDEGVDSRIVSSTLLYQISKRSPSALKNNLEIIALVYFGSYDEDKQVSMKLKELRSILLDNSSPATIKQRYSLSIINTCKNALNMSDWAIIKQSLLVLSEISKLSLFYDNYSNYSTPAMSIVSLDHATHISNKINLYNRNLSKQTEVDLNFLEHLASSISLVLKIAMGRNWPGKEGAIVSFTSILVSIKPLVLKNDTSKSLNQIPSIQDISQLYLGQLNIADVKVKRTIIYQFARFARAFDVNCFESVGPVLLRIIANPEQDPLFQSALDAPKPLVLALQATSLSSFFDFLPNSAYISGHQSMEIVQTLEPLAANSVWNVKQAAVEMSLGLFVRLLTPITNYQNDSMTIYNEDFNSAFFKSMSAIMTSAFSDLKSTNLRILGLRIAQFSLKNLQGDAFIHYKELFQTSDFNSLTLNSQDILERAKSDSDSSVSMESSRILSSLKKA